MDALVLNSNQSQQRMEDKMDKLTEAVSMMAMSKSNQSQEATVEDEGRDILDSIFCGVCKKLGYACSCVAGAFETARCVDADECGFERAVVRLHPLDLSSQTRETHSSNEQCPQCEATCLSISLNLLGSERVCEECFGVEDQDDLLCCDAKDCETDGFFHIKCMTAYLSCTTPYGEEDLYVCMLCNDKGQKPHVDESDIDVSDDHDWTAEDEFLHREVSVHNNLAVGMSMRGGKVQQILPGLDRFTVAKRSLEGICQLEHLSIMEYERRNLARSSNS